MDASPPLRRFIEQNVAFFNGTPGDPRSFDPLDDLLNEQAYRLSFWRVAADEINYRRFFDVNELAALSMEKPDVFEETHRLVLQLVRRLAQQRVLRRARRQWFERVRRRAHSHSSAPFRHS